jgi:hypothetical protein
MGDVYFGADGRNFPGQHIVLMNGKLGPWSFAGVGYAEMLDQTLNALLIWIDFDSHHPNIWWARPNNYS